MKVICISNFPDHNTKEMDFVPSARPHAKALLESSTRSLPPHVDLVAMPASAEASASNITWPIVRSATKNSVTVTSFGLEKLEG